VISAEVPAHLPPSPTVAIRAAHALASKGIPTFPCVPNEKRPLTRRGLHDATTDHGVIDAWARRWPGANLAVPMGRRSGLLALDLDRKAGRDGAATLRALERDLGELPPTLTASTWSGGEHRFFRMPSADVRNAAGKVAGVEAPGFDVRGNGGYVLIAPSSIDGRAYAWRDRRPPAELPTRWVAALSRQVEPAEFAPEPWTPRTPDEQGRAHRWCLRALQQEARELAEAPQGTRNDRLWRSAAALGGLVHLGAFDLAEVRRALWWARSTWRTRTPDKDRQTLENGLAFGLAHPRHVQIGAGDRAA
jgi:putative DNA primase/helicase